MTRIAHLVKYLRQSLPTILRWLPMVWLYIKSFVGKDINKDKGKDTPKDPITSDNTENTVRNTLIIEEISRKHRNDILNKLDYDLKPYIREEISKINTTGGK